ncbi:MULTISPECIES: hypothetical protein [unclassified Bradyrhizobium]|uniref:hypothetical protein n=1 Tax=unclassified Bradyrhizobium TaxID=2631580 RepID=UPI00247A475C|nr:MULTISPECIES: hypothetical protein [unclassified Bradyrhizobium]WGS17199.1 hypothetical protein MTX22_21160 [Bradyrhizobium sp. ISRA463]WGS30932.1 hypothetical protein MTX19_18850 [Bradyrhizobium sp. ISRA464]
MPLHRDIHWLGRQWAVTGHGLQLINQKQMGYYDIEVARLWEAGVIEAMQGKAWINRADFDKALEIARARFAHAAPTGVTPPSTPAASPPQPAPPAMRPQAELPSGPTLEELLARLKARSAAVAPAPRPVEEPAVPTEAKPVDEPVVAPVATPVDMSAIGPVAKSVAAKPVDVAAVAPKLEPARHEPPKPEASKVAQAAPELPQPASLRRITLEVSPSDFARPRPEWPVFKRKIAGRARFVRPWRARLTRWHGILPGLPPRP